MTIINAFKQWKHYLKSSLYLIKVLSDHDNLKKLMMKKELNSKQVRWAQILTVYDFKIFYRSNNRNSTNDFSRRFDYERILLLKITLLSTLQNKLILFSNEKSLTQNKWKDSIKRSSYYN